MIYVLISPESERVCVQVYRDTASCTGEAGWGRGETGWVAGWGTGDVFLHHLQEFLLKMS